MTEKSTEIFEATIKNLRLLAEGCRTHPAYRARRRATGNCEPCMRLYEARLRLDELDELEGETEIS